MLKAWGTTSAQNAMGLRVNIVNMVGFGLVLILRQDLSLCSPDCLGTCYVDQTGRELTGIPLPLMCCHTH